MNISDFSKQLMAAMLVFVGIILLGQNYSGATEIWNLVWPLFLLIPGTMLIFESHLSNSDLSRKVTMWAGSWLFLISIVFLLQIFSSWSYYSSTLFLYPFTIVLSVSFLYPYRKMPKWLKRIIWFWLLITFVTFLIGNNLQYLIWSLILILAGTWLVISSKSAKQNK